MVIKNISVNNGDISLETEESKLELSLRADSGNEVQVFCSESKPDEVIKIFRGSLPGFENIFEQEMVTHKYNKLTELLSRLEQKRFPAIPTDYIYCENPEKVVGYIQRYFGYCQTISDLMEPWSSFDIKIIAYFYQIFFENYI